MTDKLENWEDQSMTQMVIKCKMEVKIYLRLLGHLRQLFLTKILHVVLKRKCLRICNHLPPTTEKD